MNTFDFLLVFLTIEDSVLLTQRTATAALLGTTCSFIGRKKKKHANSLIWDLLKNEKYEGGRERLNVKQCFDYCENKQWWLILKCVELIQQISLSHVLFSEKMESFNSHTMHAGKSANMMIMFGFFFKVLIELFTAFSSNSLFQATRLHYKRLKLENKQS